MHMTDTRCFFENFEEFIFQREVRLRSQGFIKVPYKTDWAKNEFIIFVTLTRLDKRLANDCGGEKQKMELEHICVIAGSAFLLSM